MHCQRVEDNAFHLERDNAFHLVPRYCRTRATTQERLGTAPRLQSHATDWGADVAMGVPSESAYPWAWE
jgi:hypothetical protein